MQQPNPLYYRMKDVTFSIAMIVIALVSVLFLSGHFSSADTYSDMFDKLDEKKATVLTLSAASAATSAVLTAIPDDTCTPLAERLSEISKDFLIVLAAILLEKYMLTTLGFAFFGIIAPLSCVLLAITRFLDRGSRRQQALTSIAIRLLVFGFVLFIATPASVSVTSRIDETYAESIEETVTAAEQTTQALETAATQTKEEDPSNPIEFLQQKFDEITSAAGSAIDNLSGLGEWVQTLLSSFIEAFAVMLVTSFVIPILVPVVIYLAFKILFGQQQIVVIKEGEQRMLPSRSQNPRHMLSSSRDRDV